jgi:hypothetical protein
MTHSGFLESPTPSKISTTTDTRGTTVLLILTTAESNQRRHPRNKSKFMRAKAAYDLLVKNHDDAVAKRQNREREVKEEIRYHEGVVREYNWAHETPFPKGTNYTTNDRVNSNDALFSLRQELRDLSETTVKTKKALRRGEPIFQKATEEMMEEARAEGFN